MWGFRTEFSFSSTRLCNISNEFSFLIVICTTKNIIFQSHFHNNCIINKKMHIIADVDYWREKIVHFEG